MSELEDRVARLEAVMEIQQLVARYSFAVDDRNIEGIRALFTEDAVLRSVDRKLNDVGMDAIIEGFHNRFAVLGAGQHFMHDVQIDLIGDGRNEATGRVSGHAELARRDEMVLLGMRYEDVYRKTSQGWKFACRTAGFLYQVPADKYAGILASRLRNFATGQPSPADYPEALDSWIAYEKSRGRG